MSSELYIPNELNLTKFISQEAHDLKSPFNRALGFLKLVMKGMDGPISDQAKDDLNIAYQNTLYTLAMMSSLVEIARLELNERRPSPSSHLVELILRQVLVEWKRQYYKENTVELTFEAPNVQILSDELMIRQLFSKWISYAAEFVQENVAVHILAEEQTDMVQFTIRSSGKKVQPPAECDLTLHGYIAQRILALHQGVLQHLDETENGVEVQFTLPKA